MEPAIAEGGRREGRESEAVELSTSDFAVAGENKEEVEDQRDKMRAQISFYASTSTYRTVLEVHGWEEVGEKLGRLARDTRWDEMPALVTDEMIAAFAVEAAPDEIGTALKERYEGLIDRVALYIPFIPGERDDFWRAAINSVHAAK